MSCVSLSRQDCSGQCVGCHSDREFGFWSRRGEQIAVAILAITSARLPGKWCVIRPAALERPRFQRSRPLQALVLCSACYLVAADGIYGRCSSGVSLGQPLTRHPKPTITEKYSWVTFFYLWGESALCRAHGLVNSPFNCQLLVQRRTHTVSYRHPLRLPCTPCKPQTHYYYYTPASSLHAAPAAAALQSRLCPAAAFFRPLPQPRQRHCHIGYSQIPRGEPGAAR